MIMIMMVIMIMMMIMMMMIMMIMMMMRIQLNSTRCLHGNSLNHPLTTLDPILWQNNSSQELKTDNVL